MRDETGWIHDGPLKLWYRRVGEGGTPLLVLHGGPGAGHDYLETLEALGGERPVIFCDQLGCGKSDQSDDRSLWRLDRSVAEVDLVRRALGLERIHLLGQSWGGWLAIEYMLGKPAGIESLVLASTSCSVPQFVAETVRLKNELPVEVKRVMDHHETLGDWYHPDYEAAVMEFYKRHLCRMDPWPDPYLRTLANLDHNAVYETMNGPNEFMVIGNLREWDRSARLGEIEVPTLVTVGRYDEITPACAETIHQGITGSELEIFEQSSHTAHLEEEELYLRVVGDFLRRMDPCGDLKAMG